MSCWPMLLLQIWIHILGLFTADLENVKQLIVHMTLSSVQNPRSAIRSIVQCYLCPPANREGSSTILLDLCCVTWKMKSDIINILCFNA